MVKVEHICFLPLNKGLCACVTVTDGKGIVTETKVQRVLLGYIMQTPPFVKEGHPFVHAPVLPMTPQAQLICMVKGFKESNIFPLGTLQPSH